MQRSFVRTTQAPAAIGPYSQAVVVPMGDKRMVFCSGMIGMDPVSGALAAPDVVGQTRQAMINLAAVLAAAGARFADVVKTTIYLADFEDFGAVNQTYGEWFPQDPPARATIEVSRLPRDARIEIDMIAVI
jgi:2-iminobutanoate/2-iminopropanoate deaminase